MFKFIKKLFGWVWNGGDGFWNPTASKDYYPGSFPKSTIDVEMPPVWPLLNQYQKLVEELAYLLAERDGFQQEALHYWVEAEAQIKKKFEETTQMKHL